MAAKKQADNSMNNGPASVFGLTAEDVGIMALNAGLRPVRL
jgi:hypothetical protein